MQVKTHTPFERKAQETYVKKFSRTQYIPATDTIISVGQIAARLTHGVRYDADDSRLSNLIV